MLGFILLLGKSVKSAYYCVKGPKCQPCGYRVLKRDRAELVLVILKANKYRQFQRKCLSEHPFGTMKRSFGFGFFLLRGKEKAQAEAALISPAYNLKRAIKLLGAANLTAALTE